MKSLHWVSLALAFPLLLAGCVQAPTTQNTAPAPSAAAVDPNKPILGLTAVTFKALPGWEQDQASQALGPFLASCAHMTEALGGSGIAATLGGNPTAWKPACDAARSVPAGDEIKARAFYEDHFQPYAVSANGQDQGLFTGYYEPEVRGSRSPAAGYSAALLSKPIDLVQIDLGAFADDLKGRRIGGRISNGALIPYYDRAEISGGALRGKRLELIWLASDIDAFFLQIQGSGRIRLPDNRVVRVTYSGQNGRQYVPIGKVLADRGAIPLDKVSLQTIRAWLESHPAEANAVMDQNPSFVFFHELFTAKPDEGPPGALNTALSPGRSIAIDRAYLPLGAPVFIDTTDALTGAKFQHMMVAHDLGGAIKGPVRADIFFGWGSDAEEHAGRMRQKGRQFVLLPKSATPVAVAPTSNVPVPVTAKPAPAPAPAVPVVPAAVAPPVVASPSTVVAPSRATGAPMRAPIAPPEPPPVVEPAVIVAKPAPPAPAPVTQPTAPVAPIILPPIPASDFEIKSGNQ